MNKESTEKELQIASSHQGECLVLSQIREMQGKIAPRETAHGEVRRTDLGCALG